MKSCLDDMNVYLQAQATLRIVISWDIVMMDSIILPVNVSLGTSMV